MGTGYEDVDAQFREYAEILLAMMPLDEVTQHAVKIAYREWGDELLALARRPGLPHEADAKVGAINAKLIERLEGLAEWDGIPD